jgi:hypothetical protein
MHKLLYSLINNKKVVIVGPAPYLNNKGNGEYIDSFDTVVRCNKGIGLVQNPKIFGSRTDILYHCVNQHEDNGGKLEKDKLINTKLIVGVYPPMNVGENCSFKHCGTLNDYNNLPKDILDKFTFISKHNYLKLENEVQCRPNTGIVAIDNILLFQPKELYITGFTLFKDGYSKLYRNKIDGKNVTEKNSKFVVLNRMTKETYQGHHDQYLIWLAFKKKVLNNDKVILDKELKDILEFNIEQYKQSKQLENKTDKEIFYYYLYNE